MNGVKMFNAKVYNIMIVSPSDIIEERKHIIKAITEWNYINSEKYKIVLLPNGWELNTYPDSGSHPQNHINSQIANKADILIGVFWTRIGTKTENYQSGTIEEIERHIEKEKPAQLYFSKRNISPQEFNNDQYSELIEYKDTLKNRSFFYEFNDDIDFEQLVFKNLSLLINDKYFSERNENQISEQMDQLTNDEMELLLEAVKDDAGTILRLKLRGNLLLQTNGKTFPSNTPKDAASLEQILESLEKKEIIREISSKRESFKVLNKGYEIVNTSEISVAPIPKSVLKFRNDLNLIIDNIDDLRIDFNKTFTKILENIGQYRIDKLKQVLNELKLMNIRWSSDGSPTVTIMQPFHSYSIADIQNIKDEISEGEYDHYK